MGYFCFIQIFRVTVFVDDLVEFGHGIIVSYVSSMGASEELLGHGGTNLVLLFDAIVIVGLACIGGFRLAVSNRADVIDAVAAFSVVPLLYMFRRQLHFSLSDLGRRYVFA